MKEIFFTKSALYSISEEQVKVSKHSNYVMRPISLEENSVLLCTLD